MYCFNCGEKVDEKADICLKCGMKLKKKNAIEDRPNTGLNIISFLWPFVGLILFISLKSKTPIKAKRCGKFALFGFILYIILVIIFLTILFTSLNKINKSEIAVFSNEVTKDVILRYESDSLTSIKCYTLHEISNNNNYYGSVRVMKIKNGYKVKTYISDGNVYLVSEYYNGKKNSFNMTTGDKLNLTCNDY